MGALDFAGGTVVHISSGASALAAALIVGKRIGYGRESMPPHFLPFSIIRCFASLGRLVRFQCRKLLSCGRFSLNSFCHDKHSGRSGCS